ncbi:MAG: ATP-binding protein, partial [Pseudomonadales bacterium]
MSEVSNTTEKIQFDVETTRILGILSSEIYDSPKAFLRENVQNAYDAILMRCTAEDISLLDRKIEITLEGETLSVRDDGIGMTEEVLKQNFWKAGSSGKKTKLAQRSGVIGTFGIGAMANFGVCTALRVETRNIEAVETLISGARRDDLKIGQDCIDFDRQVDEREPGTLIVAELDPEYPIDNESVSAYLKQYVQFLNVAVTVNGKLISQERFEDTLAGRAEGFKEISTREVSKGAFGG